MQVILKKDIPDLGRMGEIVRVREGYARNYLIPRAMAAIASSSNERSLEHQKRLVEMNKKKVQKDSEALVKEYKSIEVKISRRFNESGKMYGTFSATDISQELAAKKVIIDRRNIELEPVKAAGTYTARVRLPGDVYFDLKVHLEAIEEKAAAKDSKKAKPRVKKTQAKADSEEAKSEEGSVDTEA